jgi:alpha-galactosidase
MAQAKSRAAPTRRVAKLLGLALLAAAHADAAGEPAVLLRAHTAPANSFWVEELGLEKFSQRRGMPKAGRSIRDRPILLGGVEYPRGIGTRSISEFVIDLKGGATRFLSMVGIDDVVLHGIGSVTFEVWADDVKVADSGLMRAGDSPKLLSADLRGARVLTLLVDDGGDTSNDDEVAWGGAMIELAPGDPPRPEAYAPLPEAPVVIAPPASSSLPAIHGPRTTGSTPGRPFLFRIPASGEAPLRFTARGLPAGLVLDPATGIVTGALRSAGDWRVTLIVRNARGEARRELRIVGGADALARTPPMGWNSWNVWGPAVDAQKVLAAAEALERSGLAAHGYQYIVIDDAWEGERGADGVLQPNEKFPDMRARMRCTHADSSSASIPRRALRPARDTRAAIYMRLRMRRRSRRGVSTSSSTTGVRTKRSRRITRWLNCRSPTS